MLLHGQGQASIAVCGPDRGQHKQFVKVGFIPDSCSRSGKGK